MFTETTRCRIPAFKQTVESFVGFDAGKLHNHQTARSLICYGIVIDHLVISFDIIVSKATSNMAGFAALVDQTTLIQRREFLEKAKNLKNDGNDCYRKVM